MTSVAQTMLILGGTSDIGRATARAFASNGWNVMLAGRDVDALEREADDLRARSGVAAVSHRFDILDTASFEGFLDSLGPLPDVVVSVVGFLGEQRRAEVDLEHAALIMRSNYEGPALILGLFATRFLANGRGTIVGVSSVAGDRGRASNYVYGSAKAGFTACLSGLRNSMAKRGVHVVTVKPGFVRTRMTEGMRLPNVLTVDPPLVGAAIYRAVVNRSDVIYVARVWRPLMSIIRNIPEFFFKRLSI